MKGALSAFLVSFLFQAQPVQADDRFGPPGARCFVHDDNIEQIMTQQLQGLRNSGRSFPRVPDLVSMSVHRGNGARCWQDAIVEGYVRPGEVYFPIPRMGGLSMRLKDDSVVYFCADMRKNFEESRIDIYSLRGYKLDKLNLKSALRNLSRPFTLSKYLRDPKAIVEPRMKKSPVRVSVAPTEVVFLGMKNNPLFKFLPELFIGAVTRELRAFANDFMDFFAGGGVDQVTIMHDRIELKGVGNILMVEGEILTKRITMDAAFDVLCEESEVEFAERSGFITRDEDGEIQQYLDWHEVGEAIKLEFDE